MDTHIEYRVQLGYNYKIVKKDGVLFEAVQWNRNPSPDIDNLIGMTFLSDDGKCLKFIGEGGKPQYLVENDWAVVKYENDEGWTAVPNNIFLSEFNEIII